MKKITIISAILATAVMINVTAQRRSSTREDRGVKKATTTRSYSEKANKDRESNRINNRSGSVNRSRSNASNSKEITAPSRKVETNRRASVNRDYRASTRKREVTAVRTPEKTKVNRRHANRSSRNYSPSRNEVNATRNVTHYPTHRKYVRTKKHVHVHVRKPKPVHYRAKHYAYRRPVHMNIVWTRNVYREYCVIYPELRRWRYHRGYVVHTISAYDAYYHMGEVRRVYGKVSDTFYAYKTDEYFLYIGARYPYQDFTVVVPGRIARRYHRNPERYFYRNHVEVNGLITSFDGEPEMVIKRPSQLRTY